MIYVYIDCDKTQEYVFSSRRLRGIRNGSSLIDKSDQEAGKQVNANSGNLIRALGGVVIASFPDSHKADSFLSEASDIYHRNGIGITAGSLDNSSVNNFYEDVLQPLLKEVRGKKDRPKESTLSTAGTILGATCSISGHGSAQGLVELAKGEPLQRASAVEQTKWQIDYDGQAEELVIPWENKPVVPERVEEIIDWQSSSTLTGKEETGTSESRLLGIVFADVNGMGNLLPQVSSNEKKYIEFSKALKSCLFESLQQALQEVLEKPVSRTKNRRIPFRLLFLGGDDLCYAITGAYALPLTQRFIECFEESSKKILEPIRCEDKRNQLPPYLTISAGVVIAPYKYPILSFRRLGQGLESQTKQKGRYWAVLNNKNYTPSLIDFHIVKNDLIGTVEEVRRQMKILYLGRSDEVSLFGGPYLIGNGNSGPSAKNRFLSLGNLLEAVESLLQIKAGGKLKNLRLILNSEDAPNLYREWWDHLDEAENQFQSICQKLNVPSKRETLPILDFPHLNTPVLDAIDIMPLIALKERWER